MPVHQQAAITSVEQYFHQALLLGICFGQTSVMPIGSIPDVYSLPASAARLLGVGGDIRLLLRDLLDESH